MKWQIMILTQPSRREFLEQLLSCLEPQIASLGVRKFDQVDLLIHEDNWKEPPFLGVGGKREFVRQKATGDYINWFDDDDLPAPDYIETILPLLDGIDYVGFDLEVTINKRYIGPTSHSLRHNGWTDDYRDPAHYRDISHLNPMRRELAMLKPMSGPIGEDHRWADAMRGLVKTEHYIDRVMYYYLAREGKNDAKDAQDPWRLAKLEQLRPCNQTA
jgi:Glycosyl transferase family 2